MNNIKSQVNQLLDPESGMLRRWAERKLAWAEERLNVERMHPRVLGNFESDPADEGGHTYLGLFIGTPEDTVLFAYAPEIFRISLFGRMKTAVPEALVRGT